MSPLASAIQMEDPGLVALLAENMADVNGFAPVRGPHALHAKEEEEDPYSLQ